jgi:predicted transglutaminase-like cysteine proteinase
LNPSQRHSLPIRSKPTCLLFCVAAFFTSAIAHHTELTTEVLAKIEKKYGMLAKARAVKLDELIHSNLSESETTKLNLVNDFFNGARFANDSEIWNKKDYWATPIEFIGRDAGDCEDFSIAKYYALKLMGVDTSKLRITYVKALKLNQAHMVLAYYPSPSEDPLILDNLNQRIHPAKERHDLRPVYSFNADDLWISRSRNEELKAGKPTQLRLWQDMQRRMNKEYN